LTEDRLLDPAHLAGAAARRAPRRLRTVAHLRSVAVFAGFEPGELDLLFGAEDGLLEGEIDGDLKVLAAGGSRAATTRVRSSVSSSAMPGV